MSNDKENNDDLYGCLFIFGGIALAAWAIYIFIYKKFGLFFPAHVFIGYSAVVLILAIAVLFFKTKGKCIFYVIAFGFVALLMYLGVYKYPFFSTSKLGFSNLYAGNFAQNWTALFQKNSLTDFFNELLLSSVSYGVLTWVALYALWRVILCFIPKTAEQKLLTFRKDKRVNMQTIKALAQKTDTAGFILGGVLWGQGKTYKVHNADLNKHACLIGTTGSGKTVTLYNFLINGLKNNHPVIYITAKLDQEDIKKFTTYARQYNREPIIFTMNGKNHYNPIANGTPTEITDKIIGMFDFSDDHYKASSIRFLQLLIRLLNVLGIPITFKSLIFYSNLDNLNLQQATKKTQEEDSLPSFNPSKNDFKGDLSDEKKNLYITLRGIDKKSYSGFLNRLAVLCEGDLGEMFSDTDFNIDFAIKNNQVIMFALDSLAYQEQAKQFGRLLINDIKPAVSHHQQRNGGAVTLVFDEFNVFASNEVIDVINKSRSAHFQALISFQSLADIDRVDEHLTRQIIQNCNTLIVQKQNEAKDSESLANIFGTFETVAKTYATDDKAIGADRASMRKVREYVIHPDDIKALHVGQAYIKSPSSGVAKIQVLPN